MTVGCGLLVLLEAKPGRGAELATFLEGARSAAAQESATLSWCAFKLSETTYGIFDTFTDDAGRHAHLSGKCGLLGAAGVGHGGDDRQGVA
jgi:hypothetical protein